MKTRFILIITLLSVGRITFSPQDFGRSLRPRTSIESSPLNLLAVTTDEKIYYEADAKLTNLWEAKRPPATDVRYRSHRNFEFNAQG